MSAPELVIVGRLRKAHGLRGEILVEPITDAPAEIYTAGRRLFAGTTDGAASPAGETLTIVSARPARDGLYIVAFLGLDDRTAAERWTHRYLLLPAAERPPLEEGQLYIDDLVGMRVEQLDGSDVGEIVGTFELPTGLAIEVRREADTVLLPYRADLLERVDPEGKRIVMHVPEGLLE